MTNQIAFYDEPPRFLSRADASEYLLRNYGVSYTVGTLCHLDCLGKGPGASRIGRQAVYAIGDLDRWVEGKMRASKGGSA
jgi:hypothetical protein